MMQNMRCETRSTELIHPWSLVFRQKHIGESVVFSSGLKNEDNKT